jgi:amino acid transporter
VAAPTPYNISLMTKIGAAFFFSGMVIAALGSMGFMSYNTLLSICSLAVCVVFLVVSMVLLFFIGQHHCGI